MTSNTNGSITTSTNILVGVKFYVTDGLIERKHWKHQTENEKIKTRHKYNHIALSETTNTITETKNDKLRQIHTTRPHIENTIHNTEKPYRQVAHACKHATIHQNTKPYAE